MQGVLKDTAEACGEAALAAGRTTADVCNKRELRIIQGQQHLVEPEVMLKCTSRGLCDSVMPL